MFYHFAKVPDPKIVQTDLDWKSMDLRESHGLEAYEQQGLYYAENPRRVSCCARQAAVAGNKTCQHRLCLRDRQDQPGHRVI